MPELTHLDGESPPQAVLDALARDGAVIVDGLLDPAIVEQHFNRFMPQIPKTWRVSRDAFADPVGAGSWCPVGADAGPTFANAKRQPVAARMIVVMAGPA